LNVERLRRYRFLIVVYALATSVGLWEYSRRDAPPPNGPTAELIDLEVYPTSPNAEYTKGVLRMGAGELEQARKHFERALATGVKTNENLFRFYTNVLIELKEDPQTIDDAFAMWRWNFPHSEARDEAERRRGSTRRSR
jgi:hypothetical protein